MSTYPFFKSELRNLEDVRDKILKYEPIRVKNFPKLLDFAYNEHQGEILMDYKGESLKYLL